MESGQSGQVSFKTRENTKSKTDKQKKECCETRPSQEPLVTEDTEVGQCVFKLVLRYNLEDLLDGY